MPLDPETAKRVLQQAREAIEACQNPETRPWSEVVKLGEGHYTVIEHRPWLDGKQSIKQKVDDDFKALAKQSRATKRLLRRLARPVGILGWLGLRTSTP